MMMKPTLKLPSSFSPSVNFPSTTLHHKVFHQHHHTSKHDMTTALKSHIMYPKISPTLTKLNTQVGISKATFILSERNENVSFFPQVTVMKLLCITHLSTELLLKGKTMPTLIFYLHQHYSLCCPSSILFFFEYPFPSTPPPQNILVTAQKVRSNQVQRGCVH